MVHKMAKCQVVETSETDVCYFAQGKKNDLLTGHESRVKIWNTSDSEFLSCKHTIDLATSLCNNDSSTASLGEVSSLCAVSKDVLAISLDQSVVFYDSKDLSKPRQKFPDCTKEEVNHLFANKKGDFLGVCDDSGEILVIDVPAGKKFKSCRKHENICSCAFFNPRRQWELVSGGLDCQVISWDFSKGKILSSLNMSELQPPTNPGSAYSINPPMVHALCVINEGPLFAAGLGNGCIALVNTAGKKSRGGGLEVLAIFSVHASSVNTVEYAVLKNHQESLEDVEGASGSGPAPNTDQQILLTGGNDGKIVMSTLATTLTTPPSAKKGGNSSRVHITGIRQSKPIHHGSKINFITSDNEKFYVADLTEKLTVYDLSKSMT